MKLFLVSLLCLMLCVPHVMAATVTNLQCTQENTWHTGAGTLASNAQVLTATVNQGACAGYRHADCTFNMPGAASTGIIAGGSIIVWAKITTDLAGSVFPDGGVSVTPTYFPLMTFSLSPGTGAQVVYAHVQNLPRGTFQAVIRADNTGVAINNTPSAWSLKCRPYTEQVN